MNETNADSVGPVDIRVTPTPSEGELTAILLAHEQLWPKNTDGSKPQAPPRWRFAGRWWAPRPRYGGWT